MFDESEDSTLKMPNFHVGHRFTEPENVISPVPVSEPEPDGFPLKTVCVACATYPRSGASGWGPGTDYCKN